MTASSASSSGSQVFERRIDHAGRHHHPDGARRFQLLHEILKRIRANRAFFGKRLHGIRMNVVDNAVVAGPHKTPDHVVSHPAQADHAQFHGILPTWYLMRAREQPIAREWGKTHEHRSPDTGRVQEASEISLHCCAVILLCSTELDTGRWVSGRHSTEMW